MVLQQGLCGTCTTDQGTCAADDDRNPLQEKVHLGGSEEDGYMSQQLMLEDKL